MSGWVVVHGAPNEPLARMVAGLLAAKGWPVFVRSAGIPHMGSAAPHEVLVPEEHAAEARRVLREMRKPGGAGRGGVQAATRRSRRRWGE